MVSESLPSLSVVQRRNGLVETLHPVSYAVASPGGVEVGGGDVTCFWRSACKPLQLLTALRHLPRGEEFTPEELAIGASSHSGEEVHVRHVEGLLGRFRLEAAGLRCGAHAPTHEPSARALTARGERWTSLHNNCSGKHTFMLAAAVVQGWDEDYLPLSHPLQQANAACLAGWMGVAPRFGVDGCGVPTFHAPLSAMARAWQRLARAAMVADDAEAVLAGRIVRAMAAHPELTSGTGRLDLAVVHAAGGRLAVKVGAEGLFCVGAPEADLGVAIKVHTGNQDALSVAVRAVLDRVLPDVLAGGVESWPGALVRNVARREVGDRVARWGAHAR